MEEDQINLTPEPIEDEPLDLTPAGTPRSPGLASKRAARAQFGAGVPYDKAYAQLVSGEEDELRSSVSSQANIEKNERRQKLILEVARRKGGALTQEDLDQIEYYSAGGTDNAADSVLEEKYAKQWMAYLDLTNPERPEQQGMPWHETILGQAAEKNPDQLRLEIAHGTDYKRKQEFIRKLREELDDVEQMQSMPSWLVDRAVDLAQIPAEYKSRGQVSGSEGGILLGSNVDAQGTALFRKPFAEFKEELLKIKENLSGNPGFAKRFLQQLEGQSKSEQFINNFMTGMIPTGIVGTAVGKAAVGAIGRGAARNEVRKAVVDALTHSADGNANPAMVAEGMGNVGEAGVIKSSQNIARQAAGTSDPTQLAREALPTAFRVDLGNIRQNPGRFGREIVNRLEEGYVRAENGILNALETRIQVNRTPGALASDEVGRAYKDKIIKEEFKNPSDAIVDVTGPHHEPFSNTLYFRVDVTKPNGEMFARRIDAENFARTHNLKLAEESAEISFKTAKGSHYRVQADGTTVRNKAARPEHPNDSGVKPASHKTLYIDEEAFKKVGKTGKGTLFHVDTRGNISLLREEKGKRVAIAKAASSSEPQKGLIPVELWKNKKGDYARWHFGNPITEVQKVERASAGAVVEQQGAGFYLSFTKPYNEVEALVRDAALKRDVDQTPDSYISFFSRALSRFRTPDEILSKEHRMNRKAAVYGANALLKVAAEQMDEIKKISSWTLPFTQRRKRWEQWSQIIESSRLLRDGEGRRGYFFAHPQELENYYYQTIGRHPDQQEIAAYFAWKRTLEMDHMLRNLALYRAKTRIGVESHEILQRLPDGTKKTTGALEGVRSHIMPSGGEYTIVYLDKSGNVTKFPLGKMDQKKRDAFSVDIKSGNKFLIELHDPSSYPLRDYNPKLKDARIRYVIADNVQTKPIDFNQIPFRGGGHFEYDYAFYIKQAKMRPERMGKAFKMWYEGDTTIMPTMLKSQGVDIAQKLDQFRVLLKDGKVAEAKAFATSKGFPVDFEEAKSWFYPRKNPLNNKIEEPYLNLDESIQVVDSGSRIIDVDNALKTKYVGHFEDGTRSGSLAAQHRVEFTQERDAFDVFSVKDVGSRHNPIYQVEPAKMVDVIPSMNRAMSRIIHSTYLDDYKVFAVEHWLESAKQWLDVPDVSMLRYSPFHYFLKGEFVKDTPPDIKNLLTAQRIQIEQLMGKPSAVDSYLQSVAVKFADALYKSVGPKGILANTPLDPMWLVPKLSDPTRALRALTFHHKLGLFNLPTMWVQLQTYATIFGIAGARHALPGTMGAKLMQYYRHAPQHLDYLDKMASKSTFFGWKPGEFKEAVQSLERTGFNMVGREYAALDDVMSNKVVKSGFGQFLDWGTFFFREGEQHVRYGAWFTAFREWRSKNPTGRITNDNIREILERADMLQVNMSRASSSALHTGIMSLPSQFLSYQIRLAELFWGKRLSTVERSRLMAYQMGLYGVPTGLGVTGIPIADYLRTTALENGYAPGESNAGYAGIMEGLPALAIAMATSNEGDWNGKSGTWINYGDRFGSQGFETIREVLRGDRPFMEIVGGASYSVIKGYLDGTSGLTMAMGRMLGGDYGSFQPKTEDIVMAAKEIAAVNNSWRGFIAATTGRWISKKEVALDKVTPGQAIAMSIFGVQPAAVADLHLKSWSLKDQKAVYDDAKKKFITEWQRGIREHAEDNPQAARASFRRAMSYIEAVGYPEEDRAALFSQAATGLDQNLVEKVDWKFYYKDAPADQYEKRFQTYRAKQTSLGVN